MKPYPECGKNNWDKGEIKLSWVGRFAIYPQQRVYFQSYDKKYKGKRPLLAARCLNCNHIRITSAHEVDKYL